MRRRGGIVTVLAVVALIGAFSWAWSSSISATPSNAELVGSAPLCEAGPCASTLTADDTTTAPAPSTAAPGAGPAFPTSVSANGRYLLDQFGQPYLVEADSNWCLPNRLTPAQADQLFAARAAQGFNATLVSWACGTYTAFPPDGAAYDGLTPFVGGDWSKPNPAYWDRFDQYVASAGAHGLSFLLDTDSASFQPDMVAQGAAKIEGFGRFLGARYADASNVSFLMGNDYTGNADDVMAALMDGIKAAAPNRLQSGELWPAISWTQQDSAIASRSQWSAAYSYFPTYDVVLSAYAATPTMPVLMFEANYENENIGVPGGGGPATTAETIRRQIYWTLTSGGAGQFYGNNATWTFNDPNWLTNMATPAVAQDTLATQLFRSLPWQDLAPDATFITSGQGTYDGSSTKDVLESDHATAAVTPDGQHAVVYLPTARTVTVDLSKLQPDVAATWFDPTTGATTPASAPFTPPSGAHDDGSSDWVLVLGATGGPTVTAPPGTTAPATSVPSATTTGPPANGPTFRQVATATPQADQTAVNVVLPSEEAGDANVLAIGWNDTTASISSVTDSEGNDYAAIAPEATGNGESQAIYVAKAIAGGTTTITVTFSTAARYVDLRAAEYAGVADVDAAGAASTGSTGQATASVTTTGPDRTVVMAATCSSAMTGIDPPAVARAVTSPDGDVLADQAAATAGSYTITSTGTPGNWLAQAVALR